MSDCPHTLVQGWHKVAHDADWSCRARRSGRNKGPLCSAVPNRAYIRKSLDGSTNERRYCMKHAEAKGCPKL